MQTKIHLKLKTPCSENFHNFKPTDKGGFCDSCKTEVIDFTKMNSQEITSYFKNKNTPDTCGRFTKKQLDEINKQTKNRNLFKKIGIACLSFFTFSTIQAQEVKNHIENNNTKTLNSATSSIQEDIIVEGIVSDELGPVADIYVSLQGTTTGTITDFDGKFKFPVKLKKGDILVFSNIAYKPKKVVIQNKNSASNLHLNIKMNEDTSILMGKIAVKKVYHSKKKS